MGNLIIELMEGQGHTYLSVFAGNPMSLVGRYF